jgi:hypothetical protein
VSDLRPCPFCGAQPEPLNGWIHHSADCFFVRIGLGQIGFADLNANWNTRASDATAVRLVELLRTIDRRMHPAIDAALANYDKGKTP